MQVLWSWKKERSSNHITCRTHQRNQLLNSPSTSTSFSVSSPFCIRGEITQRSSSRNREIETDEGKKQLKLQAISIRDTKTPFPQKKQRPPPHYKKKIQESRRPRLKNWCAHFLKGEEFRSNQPWSHWFLNSMTLIESKVAMALFSATSLAASSSALTWGLWRQVVALFNAFLFKRDERKCINQIVFQRRVESCCAAQIQEIHSWKSSSITLSCWVQENLSFITGYLDPRKKNKKSSFHFCGS